MNRFLNLFRHDTPPPPGQIYADDRPALFPGVLSHSARLKYWGRNDRVPGAGSFLLIGVATWSGYDMKLLDVVEGAADGPDVIGVFDTQECRSFADFRERIPDIGDVYQMPAVGFWRDGRLVASASGHEGRKLVFSACHLDVERIAELLDPYTAPA